MRRNHVVASTFAAAALATIGIAAPAAADHTAYAVMSADGAVCGIGPIASGTDRNLTTTDVTFIGPRDAVTGYVCRFAETPEPDETWIEPWTGPGPYVIGSVLCDRLDGLPPSDDARSSFRILPNGKAILRCHL